MKDDNTCCCAADYGPSIATGTVTDTQSCCCCTGQEISSVTAPMTASTQLTFKDHLGNFGARWGVRRMRYNVTPGLYYVGSPTDDSPVLVSANYKLTFDSLRKELTGLNCWLLILDTKGVNVWCAAGKGTFGTEELIARISITKLADIISGRTLILPQLGASGVNANEVRRQTGFSVIYGPIRACDIEEFIQAGNKATDRMRTVRFTTKDRLILTPIEIVSAIPKLLILFGVFFLLDLFAVLPFGFRDFAAITGAVFIGVFLVPVLLPLIPGCAFSFKGALLGLIWAAFIVWWGRYYGWPVYIGYLLALPSISAYLAMNFTGSSTYTSPSGVLKEMKIALPIMILALTIGTIWILFVHIIGFFYL